MKHARNDYNRIQDPEGKIPQDEPVFLLRGQDKFAPVLLMQYSLLLELAGGYREDAQEISDHAMRMVEWQKNVKSKLPDK